MYGNSLREEICQKSVLKSIKNEIDFYEILNRFFNDFLPKAILKHRFEHPTIGFNLFVK